jgi:N-acetylglutamate synthase-like GNAT family acetyltransferase
MDMKTVVSLEIEPSRKREIQEAPTALLPEWFGQPAANLKYAAEAEILPAYVARQNGVPRGMLLLKTCSPISAEIYWMGVDPSCHRSGIGRALVEAACEQTREHRLNFLFVCTLHPDNPDERYQRTRQFYGAMGFEYVLEEQFPRTAIPLAYYMKQL